MDKRTCGRRTPISAAPNKRLKLTAPVICGRIAFVNVKARRRSLRSAHYGAGHERSAPSVAIDLNFLSASCSGARSAPVGARSGPPVTLLDGNWELNLARTHYGRGVDRRRREVFTCGPRGELVHCVIRSVRTDGRVVVGEFGATLDGVGARVSGVAGVDEVQLNQSTDS